MAIERQYGEQTLICDFCEDDLGLFFSPGDFPGMIAYAKQHGWKIAPDGDDGWTHNCGCNTETALERAQHLLG